MGVVVVKGLLFAFGGYCDPVELAIVSGKHLDANKRDLFRADIIGRIRRLQCQKRILHHFNIIVIEHRRIAFIDYTDGEPGLHIRAATMGRYRQYLFVQVIFLYRAQGKFYLLLFYRMTCLLF